jgi:hypothetical protein
MPKQLLALTDNILVRIILLIGLISTAYRNPVLGVAVFMVVSFLFIERNKAKMVQLKDVMTMSNGPYSEAVVGIETPPTAPLQPPFLTPPSGSIPFMPDAETGDNSFAPVAPSMDMKQPLPTESVDGSQKAIHELFEWVHPAVNQ